jgi:hypothetical protein
MKLRHLYLLLCVPGALLPYAQFLPWLAEHGPDLPRLFAELFSTRIGAFFGLDVLVSAVVLLVFVASEGRRLRMRRLWAPVAATLLVGVSLGLPLFLYLRQATLDADERR